MTATNVNWKKVEKVYRTGLIGVVEIAKQCGLSETAIRKRAKKHGWRRDLAAKVKAKSKRKMVLALTDEFDGSPDPTDDTDQSIIDLAVATQVAVVREHRVAIRNGQNLTKRLLDELNATTTHVGELEDMITSQKDGRRRQGMLNSISLPSRAAVMRDLANAARTWTTMERQSFGIDDRHNPNEDRSFENQTAEQLRAEILNDLANMTASGAFTKEDIVRLLPGADGVMEPQGVANRKRTT